MTTSELRGQFDFYYSLECKKRQVGQINFGDQEFLLMYSVAMMDISDRLKMLKDMVSIAITPVSTYTEYTLGRDYGGFIKAEWFDASGNFVGTIPELPYDKINTASLPADQSQMPSGIIIFPDGADYKLVLQPMANQTGTLKLHYLKITDLYAPSKGMTQITPTSQLDVNVGVDYANISTTIPDRYIQGAIYHMLGQIFDDLMARYEAWLYRMKANRIDTKRQATKYKTGGLS